MTLHHFWPAAIPALLLAGANLSAQSEASTPIQRRPDWVIRHIVESVASPHAGSGHIDWAGIELIGDLDQDSHQESIVLGSESLPPYRTFMALHGAHPFRPMWLGSLPIGRTFNLAMLRQTPSGQEFLAPDPNGDLLRLSFPGMAYLGKVPAPPAWGGNPPADQAGVANPAEDMNGDGWSDPFCSTGILNLGMPPWWCAVFYRLDGATLQPIWMTYLPGELWGAARRMAWTEAPADFDGDQVEDFVVRTSDWTSFPAWVFHGISGANGAVLWTHAEPLASGVYPSTEYQVSPDLDQDGTADLVVFQFPWSGADPGRLYALSGRTGTLIWENRTLGDLDPGYGVISPPRTVRFNDMCPVGDLDRDGRAEIGLWAEESSPVFPFGIPRIYLFSGADGSFLWTEDLPRDRGPFSAVLDHLNPSTLSNPRGFLGDIDEDGLVEWCISDSRGGVNPPTTDLIVLGRRTLFVEPEVPLGETAHFEVDIPNGAACNFQILLSWDLLWQGGAVTVGAWSTDLGPGSLLSWSAHFGGLAGTLDGVGRASVSLALPAQPGLIGRVLYSRALVEEPGAPGSLRTMSSLGSTKVLP